MESKEPSESNKRPRVADVADVVDAEAEAFVQVEPNVLKTTLDKFVLDQIMCTICANLMSGHIYQCQNGHTVCHQCQPKLTACHMCRVTPMTGRCLVLEQLRAVMDLPCKYDGCGHTAKGIDAWLAHKSECKFNEFRCPFEECNTRDTEHSIEAHKAVCVHRVGYCPLKYVGSSHMCNDVVKYADVITHLKTRHADSMLIKPIVRGALYAFSFGVTRDQQVDVGKWIQYMTTTEGDMFMFRAVAAGDLFYATVRSLTATPFVFRILTQLTKLHGPNRTFQGDVLPVDSAVPIKSPQHALVMLKSVWMAQYCTEAPGGKLRASFVLEFMPKNA